MITADEESVLKVLDIQRMMITSGLLLALRSNETYRDTIGVEDIYTILVEENMGAQLDKYERAELQEILQLCDKFDCSYFRIINI